MVRVAVQVVDPPMASVVAGQLIADRPGRASVIFTDVRVTLPVFVTANENVCVSPNDAPAGAVSVVKAADLVSDSVLTWLIGVAVDELFDVTAGPVGGLPDAVAVFATTPAFTSLWVMVRVAVHVVDPVGIKMINEQLMVDRPGSGSVTLTAVSVTFPVFTKANENVCMSPNDAPAGAVSVVNATDLVSVSVFACPMGVDVDEVFDVTVGPKGGVAFAVAVLLIVPAFTSAWVMVRVAVHVVDSPGAKVVDGQLMADKPGSGSLIVIVVRVTLPVLVTRNENVCVSPNDGPVGAVSVVNATDLARLSVLV